MSLFTRSQPKIPNALLHPMNEIRSRKIFDQENGGQWTPGTREKIAFRGVVLPVTDKDLIRDTAGTITNWSAKIYTNGHKLAVGAQVEDQDGAVYTVTQELDHNSLHPMKRYLAERKGEAAMK